MRAAKMRPATGYDQRRINMSIEHAAAVSFSSMLLGQQGDVRCRGSRRRERESERKGEGETDEVQQRLQ